jgi:hypothetical protein
MTDHHPCRSRPWWRIAALVVAVAFSGCSGAGSGTAPSAGSSSDPSESLVPSTTVAPATTTTTMTVDPASPSDIQFEWPATDWTESLGYYDPPFDQRVRRSAVAGDLVGSMFSALLSAGKGELGLTWFEGSVATCGSGGMTIRSLTETVGTGTATELVTRWDIVAGLGVGDLSMAAGSGIARAQGNVWSADGVIVCRPPGDDGSLFSTTLFSPAPLTGLDAQLPAHSALRVIPRTIDPSDYDDPLEGDYPYPRDFGSTSTLAPLEWGEHPIITLESLEYVDSRMWSLTFTAPPSFPGPLRNTFVALLVGPTWCSEVGQLRLVIDDVLYPEFRGAWDMPPQSNDGAMGGGPLDGPGRVSCA